MTGIIEFALVAVFVALLHRAERRLSTPVPTFAPTAMPSPPLQRVTTGAAHGTSARAQEFGRTASAPLKCALIVEDNDALREAMATTVRQLGAEVFEASTARDAIARLTERTPDLVIVDVCLPDGSAHALFDALRRLTPRPLEIGISGQASAEQVFELAQLGVRAYLAKPFSLQDLRETIERIRKEPPPPEPSVRALVGLLPLHEVTSRVRTAMIDEALARSGGSRSRAARLLDEALARSTSMPAGISKLGRFIEGCWDSWYAFVGGLRENGLVEPDAADEDLLAALETARREHASLPERLRRFNSLSERVRFFLSPYLSEKGLQWSVNLPEAPS